MPADGEKNFLGGLRIILSEIMGLFILNFFVLLLTNPQLAITKSKKVSENEHPHHKHTEIVPYIEHPFFVLIYVTTFVYIGVKFAPMQGSINPAINLCNAIMGDIR